MTGLRRALGNDREVCGKQPGKISASGGIDIARPTLSLLGGFKLCDALGAECVITGAKPRALLAALAVSPEGRMGHEQIAALLWSDRATPQARDSLKHALADLRATFSGHSIDAFSATRQSVMLDLSQIVIDVRDFSRFARSSDPRDHLLALESYVGDFLDGLSVPDGAFEDWLRQERSLLKTKAETIAASALNHAQVVRDNAEIRKVIEKLLWLDPLREDAVRAAMQNHATRGERTAALRLFAELRDRLAAELNAAPEPETIALEASLRNEKGDTGADGGMTIADLSLPERPSIAVLPFRNIGGDQEQDYFADGVSEDIIIALSHYRWFFVIARNSSFVFRDCSADMKAVARSLGVRYILDGSIRRSETHVRLTSELVEPESGVQVWGGSFDGKVDDIFAIQNDLTRRVVGAIEPEIQRGESLRALMKPATNLAAYDCHMRGVWHHNRQDRREDFLEGIRWQLRASELDPSLARAHMIRARAHYALALHGFSQDLDSDRRGLLEAASRAIALEDRDAYSHYAMCLALLTEGKPSAAVIEAERALELAPNLALAQNALGWARIFSGRPELALDPIRTAMRLSPLDPVTYFFDCCAALAHYHQGDFIAAVNSAQRAFASKPRIFNVVVLLACLGRLGRRSECGVLYQQFQSLEPIEPEKYWRYLFPYADETHRAHLEDGIRLAGIDPVWMPSGLTKAIDRRAASPSD